MKTITVSAAAALMLALMGTPLAIRVFSRRGRSRLIREETSWAHAARRETPTMGGTVLVAASLAGYIAGHVLTRDPTTVSGIQVLGLMAGLGLAGFAVDFISIHRHTGLGRRRGAKPAHGLDRLQIGAVILLLAADVLIFNWQLGSDCTVLLTKNCYVVRDPLDLAVVAASVLGGCLGFLWHNARRARIFMGATGTLALGGVLAGLAVTGQPQLLLAVGGLFVIITLSVIRRGAARLPIRARADAAACGQPGRRPDRDRCRAMGPVPLGLSPVAQLIGAAILTQNRTIGAPSFASTAPIVGTRNRRSALWRCVR
jgi:phospho-N-acetylmuramoyl-pentapeptide-transferase